MAIESIGRIARPTLYTSGGNRNEHPVVSGFSPAISFWRDRTPVSHPKSGSTAGGRLRDVPHARQACVIMAWVGSLPNWKARSGHTASDWPVWSSAPHATAADRANTTLQRTRGAGRRSWSLDGAGSRSATRGTPTAAGAAGRSVGGIRFRSPLVRALGARHAGRISAQQPQSGGHRPSGQAAPQGNRLCADASWRSRTSMRPAYRRLAPALGFRP